MNTEMENLSLIEKEEEEEEMIIVFEGDSSAIGNVDLCLVGRFLTD